MAREVHTLESDERDAVCRHEHRVSFLASSIGSDHTRAQNVRFCLLIATSVQKQIRNRLTTNWTSLWWLTGPPSIELTGLTPLCSVEGTRLPFAKANERWFLPPKN